MARVWMALPVVITVALAPRPVDVRISVQTSRAPSVASQSAIAVLRRALVEDLLIAPAAPERRDGVAGVTHGGIYLIRGYIAVVGPQVELCLALHDALTRPIAGPDTVQVLSQQLDSALAAFGHRYAHVLAQPRITSRTSNGRCV